MYQYKQVKFMGKYYLFKRVPDNSHLADRLNKIMDKLSLLRARTRASSFDFNKDTATWFYYTCLFEEWSHEVIRKLYLWKELTDLHPKWTEIYDDNGLVETTTCDKFDWLRIALQEGTKSINDDIEKFADKESDFYKQFCKMTIEEKDLQRAVAMADADDDFLFVIILCYNVTTICTTLRFLDKTQDNVEELRKINREAGNLLNGIFIESKAEANRLH